VREPSPPPLFVPAPAQDTEIVFGPGVQLDCEAHQASLDDISAQVTRMEIDAPWAGADASAAGTGIRQLHRQGFLCPSPCGTTSTGKNSAP